MILERQVDDRQALKHFPPAMKPKQIRLFIKPFCGWCDEGKDWLDKRGLNY